MRVSDIKQSTSRQGAVGWWGRGSLSPFLGMLNQESREAVLWEMLSASGRRELNTGLKCSKQTALVKETARAGSVTFFKDISWQRETIQRSQSRFHRIWRKQSAVVLSYFVSNSNKIMVKRKFREYLKRKFTVIISTF